MDIIINDLKVNYIVKGEGKNILLLHGWGCNGAIFNKIIDNLSKNNKIYALDLPGFGLSDEPPVPWTVDDYTDLVIKFIKEMGMSSLSLIGHSFGGRIIIKLFSKKIDFDVEKVVLIDAAGIKPKRNSDNSLKVKVNKMSKKLVFNKATNKMFPELLNKIKSKVGSEDYKSATPKMRDTLVKVVNEDLEHLLPNINVPTLLIWGELDTATPISDAYTMESVIPDAGLVVLKGRGHYAFLEEAPTVNKVLDSFFGGLDGK